ncbi:MAG TPA: hypothetical protein GX715_12070 [Armatimonadetes bacterium]|nr:hypothetical protein [Armatimonadota bacterium]
MPDVRRVAEHLDSSGADLSEYCGLHVHVDASNLDGRQLTNLLCLAYRYQSVVTNLLHIHPDRMEYCQPLDEYTANYVARRKPETAWQFNQYLRTCCTSRYRTVNFWALSAHDTVEFRWYNATLNPDLIAAYIDLSVGFVARACRQQRASTEPAPFSARTARENTRQLLSGLGFAGPEYRKTRQVLMERLAHAC